MMAPDLVLGHELEDREFVSIYEGGRRENADYLFILSGAGGLETVIRFDGVDGGYDLEFYRVIGGEKVVTGSIEDDSRVWGPVGEWIRDRSGQLRAREKTGSVEVC